LNAEDYLQRLLPPQPLHQPLAGPGEGGHEEKEEEDRQAAEGRAQEERPAVEAQEHNNE
jgi:hypothetical protein